MGIFPAGSMNPYYCCGHVGKTYFFDICVIRNDHASIVQVLPEYKVKLTITMNLHGSFVVAVPAVINANSKI
jgi:hypothetical protein